MSNMASAEHAPAMARDFDVEDLSGGLPAETKQQRCVDCSTLSPPTHSSFTLISATYGWRLQRDIHSQTGEVVFEWRCPGCARAWTERRQLRMRALMRSPRK